MTAHIVKKIEEMDDFKVVRFFNFFNEKLFEGIDVSNEEVLKGIPESIEGIPDFTRIRNLSEEERKTKLDPSESATMARTILVNLAQDNTFSPLLGKAVEEYKDDELIVGAILAVGAAASLIIMAATTELKGEAFGIKFTKSRASPEIVKAAIEPFTGVLRK